MRVLHVTECFGGGVATAIAQYARSTPGAEHDLLFAERSEAPVSSQEFARFATSVMLPTAFPARVALLRRLVAEGDYDTVHAHSSIAGLLVRTALSRRRIRIVYTPHCFAYLRQDLGGPMRAAIRLAELVLSANTTRVAACSPFEARAAARGLSAEAPVYVPNVAAPVAHRVEPPSPRPGERIRILGIGRIVPQKGADFFAATVLALRSAGVAADAEWIGDGAARERAALEHAGVRVRGWLTHEEVQAAYGERPTVYLHTARWEGFPLGILEASAASLPVVVRDLPLYAGIALPNTVRRPRDAAPILARLLANPDAWHAAVAATRGALVRNTEEVQALALATVYAGRFAGVGERVAR